jgi:hypothetical protein
MFLINYFFRRKISGKSYYYFVHKGQHKSKRQPGRPRIVYISDSEVLYDFTIDKSWIYPADFDVGWNKLPGLSSLRIHKNSARVGWRCTGGEIKFASYCYVDGERIIKEFEKKYNVGDKLVVAIKQTKMWCDIHINKEKGGAKGYIRAMRWLTHFYFGGTKPAPHHIETTVKYL